MLGGTDAGPGSSPEDAVTEETAFEIEVGARSEVGRVRHNNEDSFAVDLPLRLFVVCDGMGGQAAGEVASRMGVEVTLKHLRQASQDPALPLVGTYRGELSPQTNRLASAIRLANWAIFEAGESRVSHSGMGSTVVAVELSGDLLSIAHVGDSRVYRFRDGTLRQLTQDHSLVMEQVRQGKMTLEQAENSEWSNVIIRALGAEPDVAVDLLELPVEERDQFLLCSDGLTRMIPDEGIAEVLATASTARKASERLVEIANRNGGKDNVTVIVVRLKARPRWRRWKLTRLLLGDA
jgi:PPM family protein phosphatase